MKRWLVTVAACLALAATTASTHAQSEKPGPYILPGAQGTCWADGPVYYSGNDLFGNQNFSNALSYTWKVCWHYVDGSTGQTSGVYFDANDQSMSYQSRSTYNGWQSQYVSQSFTVSSPQWAGGYPVGMYKVNWDMWFGIRNPFSTIHHCSEVFYGFSNGGHDRAGARCS